MSRVAGGPSVQARFHPVVAVRVWSKADANLRDDAEAAPRWHGPTTGSSFCDGLGCHLGPPPLLRLHSINTITSTVPRMGCRLPCAVAFLFGWVLAAHLGNAKLETVRVHGGVQG